MGKHREEIGITNETPKIIRQMKAMKKRKCIQINWVKKGRTLEYWYEGDVFVVEDGKMLDRFEPTYWSMWFRFLDADRKMKIPKIETYEKRRSN